MFHQNKSSSYGRGQSLTRLNPQWLAIDPAEQLQMITLKASRLEAKRKQFLTAYQHQQVLQELAKLEAECQKLLEDSPKLIEEETETALPDADINEVTEDPPQHGYIANPMAEKAFAKNSRRNWLAGRLAFLYTVKTDVLKEIAKIQRELQEYNASSSSLSSFDKLLVELE